MNAALLTVVLGIGTILSFFKKIASSYFYWILAFILSWLIATRGLTVPDTVVYQEFYLSLNIGTFQIVNYGFEPGFQMFSQLARFLLGDHYTLYFGLIVLINLAVLFHSIDNLNKNEKEKFSGNQTFEWSNKLFPLILYIAYFGLYYNAIVLRAGLAISFLIWSTTIACKLKKKTTDYWIIGLLNLLAFTIHYTAIIGIPILSVILFSSKKKIQTYFILWIIVFFVYLLGIGTWFTQKLFAGIVSFLFHSDTLFQRFLSYEDNSFTASSEISFKFIFYWLLGFVFLNVKKMPEYYYKYLNVYLLGLSIFAFFKALLLIERISDYFLIYSFVLLILYLRHKIVTTYSIFLYTFSVFVQLIFALRIINRSPL